MTGVDVGLCGAWSLSVCVCVHSFCEYTRSYNVMIARECGSLRCLLANALSQREPARTARLGLAARRVSSRTLFLSANPLAPRASEEQEE